MDKRLNIISEACLKFHDSGRASVTAEAREIMGALEDAGYVIVSKEDTTKTLNEILMEGEARTVKIGNWYSFNDGSAYGFFYIYGEMIDENRWVTYGLFNDPIEETEEWIRGQELNKDRYANQLSVMPESEVMKRLIGMAKEKGSEHIRFGLFKQTDGSLQLRASKDPDLDSLKWDVILQDGNWRI